MFALFSPGTELARFRRGTLPRLALGGAFAVGYWTLFTGNGWVALSGYHFRYFYPVIMFVVVCIAAPIAGILVGLLVRPEPAPAAGSPTWSRWSRWSWWSRARGSAAARVSVLAVSALACGVAVAGPISTPDQSPVLVQSRATGQYAVTHDVRFVSGYYWAMWPVLHAGLAAGRDALFVTGFKSGGDPAGYRNAFREELAKGPGFPRAMCVNAPVSDCLPYLNYWTAPGWVQTGDTCPVPGDVPALGSPSEHSCRILEYRGVRS